MALQDLLALSPDELSTQVSKFLLSQPLQAGYLHSISDLVHAYSSTPSLHQLPAPHAAAFLQAWQKHHLNYFKQKALGLRLVNVKHELFLNIGESSLPVQQVHQFEGKPFSQGLYSSDDRNPGVDLYLTLREGGEERERRVRMSKHEVHEFFQQVQKAEINLTKMMKK